MICAETPFAQCDSCGWHGSRRELVEGSTPLDEACPECLSDRTWWTAERPERDPDGARGDAFDREMREAGK